MKPSTKSDERAKEWDIILNKPVENTTGFNINNIYSNLKAVYSFVAIIEHDQDKYENGEPKTIHYHVVLLTNRMRKQTIINDLSEILSIPQNCISVEKVISMRKALRYLTHLDHPEKAQYPPFMVMTNNQNYYQNCLVEREELLTPELLIKIVDEERTTTKILLKIGNENYKKWATIIRDLQKERENR